MVQSENPVKMLWHEEMIIMFLRMMEGMIAVQSFFYYNNLQNQAQLASYRMIYLQFLKGHSHESFLIGHSHESFLIGHSRESFLIGHFHESFFYVRTYVVCILQQKRKLMTTFGNNC